MAQNEFMWRGALGGLIAADDQIQKETNDRLENQRKMIEVVGKALDLSIASKYKERKAKAETETLESTAEHTAADAEVATRTRDSRVLTSEAEASSAQTKADYAERQQQADLQQKTSAARANDAQTRMLGEQADMYKIESLAKINETYASADAKRAAIRQEDRRIANDEQQFALRHQQAQQEIEIAKDQVTIQLETLNERLRQGADERETAQLAREIKAEQLRIEKLESRMQRALHLAQAKKYYWDSVKTEAEAEALSGGAGKSNIASLPMAKINELLGFDSAEAFAGEVTEEMLDELNLGKWGSDIETDTAEARFLKNNVATYLRRYKQLAMNGVVPPLPVNKLKNITKGLMLDTYVDGATTKTFSVDIDGNNNLSDYQDYWSDVRGILELDTKTLGQDPSKGYALGSLNARIAEAQNKGIPIPPDLKYEYLIRNASR